MDTMMLDVENEIVKAFDALFNNISRDVLEKAREALLEGSCTVTRESLVAQIIMEEMFAHPCDPNLNNIDEIFTGKLTPAAKVNLIRMADHMGPEWTQALYHAAVFMTKVA